MNVNGNNLVKTENKNMQKATTFTAVKSLLANVNYKRFEEILGRKAQGFMSSIINISNSVSLQGCEPNSIISSAVVAATLDLPIDQNLGFAYIVPYNDKKKGKIAQFQMGYKGFIQLAMRSGQYKTISAGEVYENEIKKYNRITGEIEFNEDFSSNEEPKVVGYIAYFKLLNGFEKYLYMTTKKVQEHGKKYSQSYKSEKQWVRENCLWSTNFDAMATKTVLKLLLSKYGILSIEMQTALKTDQAVINNVSETGEIDASYIDNPDYKVEDMDAEHDKTEDGTGKDEKSGENKAGNPEDQISFKGTPFEDKQ